MTRLGRRVNRVPLFALSSCSATKAEWKTRVPFSERQLQSRRLISHESALYRHENKPWYDVAFGNANVQEASGTAYQPGAYPGLQNEPLPPAMTPRCFRSLKAEPMRPGYDSGEALSLQMWLLSTGNKS